MPSNGRLIGRSDTCGDVPVRSTVISSPRDRDRHGDLQIAPRRIRIVQIAVDEGLGRIDAVGNVADGAAHQAFGIVHQVFAGAVDRGAAVAAHEIEVALRADLRGGDLRIHVADHQIRDADVVAHDVPDRIVAPALVDDLDRLELQALPHRCRLRRRCRSCPACARRCRDDAPS